MVVFGVMGLPAHLRHPVLIARNGFGWLTRGFILRLDKASPPGSDPQHIEKLTADLKTVLTRFASLSLPTITSF